MSWVEHFALGGILVFAATMSLLAAGNILHDPANGPTISLSGGTPMYHFDKLHRSSSQACLAGCEMMVVKRTPVDVQKSASPDLFAADFQVK